MGVGMRGFLGLIGGLVAGIIALLAIGYVGGMLFPIPIDPHIRDAIEQATAALPNAPLGAKLFIAASWFGAGLFAALVAKAISRSSAVAWSAVGILTVLTLANVFLAPFPAWMEIASVALPLVGGLIGNHLVNPAAVVVTSDAPVEEI